MRSLPVAMYQMDVIFGKADENIQKIKTEVKQIKEEHTLLVLPELCLTGYSKEEIERTAFSKTDSSYLELLANICLDNELMIFASIAEKKNENYYNTAVFIDASGLIASYRKSHLFGPMGEKQLFKSGDRVISMSYNEIYYGLSICYDLRFPSMYQKLAEKGVHILLVVAEWPITRVNHWTALLKARAIENQCFVIGLNRVGSDGSYTYGGHSAVYSPYGETVLEIPHSDETMAYTSVELKLVQEFRKKFDVRHDRVLDIDNYL